jgi:hypothetical protein
VIGFDNERHVYGEHQYPGQLVLQDVLTLHGSQFRDVALIVASPPCQAYSYRAMPWKRAKALPPPDNTLFDACFRIKREACEAAGRRVPMVVENVCGAQKWVGRARWHYGSFYLWGDVPALMPIPIRRGLKGIPHTPTGHWTNPAENGIKGGWHSQANGAPMRRNDGCKSAGMNWSDRDKKGQECLPSKSPARKAASAMIAKIPFELARHVAACWKPKP